MTELERAVDFDDAMSSLTRVLDYLVNHLQKQPKNQGFGPKNTDAADFNGNQFAWSSASLKLFERILLRDVHNKYQVLRNLKIAQIYLQEKVVKGLNIENQLQHDKWLLQFAGLDTLLNTDYEGIKVNNE